MSELKPCPFCGGSPELHHRKSGGEPANWERWYYTCTGCFVELRWEPSIEMAAFTWNTRAQDKEAG